MKLPKFFKRDNYWRDIIDNLPPPPAVEYDLVVDPKTGITSKVERPVVFKPII